MEPQSPASYFVATPRKTLFAATLVGLLFGILLVLFGGLSWHAFNSATITEDLATEDAAPLYWVAPMDANYRRDEPGKSPMGMDLVPVYAKDETASPGTVTIAPEVVQNLGVKTFTVTPAIPDAKFSAFGELAYPEHTQVTIHSRVTGWINELFVRTNGAYVRKGQALYSLYAPELVFAQEEYIVALQQQSRTLVAAAKRRLQALAAPDSLITTLSETQTVQQNVVFSAPQDGFILNLTVKEGMYVTPAKSFMTLVDTAQMWAMLDIFAQDVNKLTIGQEVQIRSEVLLDQTVTGTVDYIYPAVSAARRTAQVRVVLPNPGLTLRAGQFVQADISAVNELEKLLLVPAGAVIRTGEQNRVVLALGDGRFKSIEVELGQRYQNGFAISSGLRAGDDIVTDAHFLLDSESSISSDFMRFDRSLEDSQHTPSHNTSLRDKDKLSEEMAHESMPHMQELTEDLSDWTHATINEVMVSERLLNLTHGPLENIGMMGMTMNFLVAEDIDLSAVSPRMEVHVEIVPTSSGMYEVRTLHFMSDMEMTQ